MGKRCLLPYSTPPPAPECLQPLPSSSSARLTQQWVGRHWNVSCQRKAKAYLCPSDSFPLGLGHLKRNCDVQPNAETIWLNGGGSRVGGKQGIQGWLEQNRTETQRLSIAEQREFPLYKDIDKALRMFRGAVQLKSTCQVSRYWWLFSSLRNEEGVKTQQETLGQMKSPYVWLSMVPGETDRCN